MTSYKNFVVASLALGILTLTVFSAEAEPTAPVSEKVTIDHKAPPAVEVTLKDLEKRPKTKLKIAKTDTVLYVADLHCVHCAKSISSKLYTVKGVVKVRTDLKADVAIITPQTKKKIDPMSLWKAAQKSGFPALKLVGPDGTYVLDAKTKQAVRLAEKKAETQKS